MNFEIGKYYKTRGGVKVKLVHVFPDRYILFASDDYSLKNDGDGINPNDRKYDIISEWVEPRSVDLYIGYDFNAQEYVISVNKPDMKRFTWFKRTFTEGQE